MIVSQQLDYDRGLREFLEKALRKRMPALIDFALGNQTLLVLVRHLRRHNTSSLASCYMYLYGCWRYCLWLNREPDGILRECWGPDGDPLPKMLRKHVQLVDDFVGYCQDQGMAPGTAANHAKAAKALYDQNGLKLDLPKYPRTALYPDRAPTPEELERVIAIADVRQRVIVALPALSGVRESTLCQLTYGHVRTDLEAGVVPVLLRIEPRITKGRYGGYTSFLGPEAAEYLKAYLQERRQGSEKFPPEVLRNDSPLIRDSRYAEQVRPITPGAVWRTVHELYVRAGLIQRCEKYRDHRKGKGMICEYCGWPKNGKRRHELRVHSLRYYFRTQLTSRGVNPEYAEHMMGHVGPLYNDIRSKGAEFLRNIYRASGLSIKQTPKASRLDLLKELVRGFGMDPEKVLVKEALVEPHRAIVSSGDNDDTDSRILARALRENLLQDLATRQSHVGIFDSGVESPPGYHAGGAKALLSQQRR
jgi:integrase